MLLHTKEKMAECHRAQLCKIIVTFLLNTHISGKLVHFFIFLSNMYMLLQQTNERRTEIAGICSFLPFLQVCLSACLWFSMSIMLPEVKEVVRLLLFALN